MRDIWYGDSRDLIKWGILLRLASAHKASRIIQLAYYRPGDFGRLEIDGDVVDIPLEVVEHFRCIRKISGLGSDVRVTVFDPLFQDRQAHQRAVLALLPAFSHERCIVFLDPDTGLEPGRPTFDHVLESEVKEIWGTMKSGDVFAFYQHQTNRNGQPWIGPKQQQLARAIDLECNDIKIGSGPEIARDVVFFYAQKAEQGAQPDAFGAG